MKKTPRFHTSLFCSRARSWTTTVLCVLCWLAAPMAFAGEPQEASASAADQASEAQEPVQDGTVDPSAGLWIFLDPDTLEPRATPTPEQAAKRRAWSAALNKSDQGLEPFALEAGGTGVHLKGRFRHALTATVLPDGRLAFRCSDHADEDLLVPATPQPTVSEPAPEQ